METIKTVIYLDQNYLSDLARARLGMKTSPNYLPLWEQLLGAVQNEVAVCPFSPFRRTESELLPSAHRGGLQESDLYGTAKEIWCGVEFRGFEGVLRAQARSSLKRFLGMAAGMYELLDGFTADPHGPCQSANPLEPYSARFASWTRWVKQYHERKGMAKPSRNFSAQKQVEALATIQNLYVNPAMEFTSGSFNIFNTLDFSLDLFRAYAEFTGAEDDGLRIGEFLRSDQMAEVPFIDIHSSLVAEMVVSGRKARGGDLEDVLAISTVLPYCDILATDSYMKDLVQRLKLDEQYDTRVFSARKADVLAFTSLVTELAHCGA